MHFPHCGAAFLKETLKYYVTIFGTFQTPVRYFTYFSISVFKNVDTPSSVHVLFEWSHTLIDNSKIKICNAKMENVTTGVLLSK